LLEIERRHYAVFVEVEDRAELGVDHAERVDVVGADCEYAVGIAE
jgi:hypothetical protein